MTKPVLYGRLRVGGQFVRRHSWDDDALCSWCNGKTAGKGLSCVLGKRRPDGTWLPKNTVHAMCQPCLDEEMAHRSDGGASRCACTLTDEERALIGLRR